MPHRDVLGAALVRVAGDRGTTGSGFLLAPDQVATCARVVADALDAPRNGDTPTGTVWVEFRQRRCRAEIAHWYPAAGRDEGDFAILRLVDPAPPGVVSVPTGPIPEFGEREFHAVGIGAGDDEKWISGKVRAGRAPLRFEGQQTDDLLSGGPVWDEELGCVVGVIVVGDGEPCLRPVAWEQHTVSRFPGLRAFGEDRAPAFYGRGSERTRLLEQIRRRRLAAVTGPADSGKSSLVRAGVLPALRAEGREIVEVRAEADSIASAFGVVPDQLGELDLTNVVLFLDQFEDLVLDDPVTARRLVGVLTRIVHGSDGATVVLTLRSGSLDQLISTGCAADLSEFVFFLGPMSREQLRAVLTEPEGLVFEDGLVERILDDAENEPGALPLVAHVLDQLWRTRRGGWLTHQAYERAGGISDAVAQYAERAYAATDAKDAQRLLTLLADYRCLQLSELPVDLRTVARDLARSGLLDFADQRVRLVRRSLLDRWPRLREWAADEREFRSWQEHAAHTERLRGTALARAVRWLKHPELTSRQRALIERSRATERAQTRQWTGITAAAVVLALVASMLTVVVADRSGRFYDQLRTANSAFLARKANHTSERRPRTALQMALAAWREKPYSSPAYGALLEQRLYWRGTDRLFQGTGRLDGMLLSNADGSVVVTAKSKANGISVWHQVGGARPERSTVPVDRTNQLRMSPDGGLLAEQEEATVRLWRTVGKAAEPMILNTGTNSEIGFSPNGRYVAVLPKFADAPVQVWDTRTGQLVASQLIRSLPGTRVVQANPTSDGNFLVFEETGLSGNPPRVVVRGLDGAEVRVFEGATAIGSGSAAMRCSNDEVTVLDTSTARTMGTASGYACPATDATGQFLLLAETGEDVSEVVHWPTWQRYVLADPVQRRKLASDSVLSFASRDGVRTLAVADGALRANYLRTTTEKPVSTETFLPSLTEIAPGGRGWVTYDETRGLALLDSDGEVSESIEVERPQAISFDSTGKHVLTVTSGWLRVYDADDLTLRSEKRLPGADGSAGPVSILPYTGSEVLVVHAGRLSFWDTTTAEQLSDPLRLDSDERVGAAVLRPGWGQVLVNHGDGLSLWDLEEHRRVARFAAELHFEEEPVLDPAASVAAAPTTHGEVVVADLSRASTAVLSRANAQTVHGLADDYVFVENLDRFQVWDWKARKLVASVRLDDGYRDGTRSVTAGELVLNSMPGKREALPLDPEKWFRDLCGLADRGFTAAEQRMLPVGAERDRPCRVLLESLP